MTTYLSRFVFLTALAHFVLELSASFLPIVYPLLITTFELSYSQIGLIALVISLFGALTMPFFGYLSDRFGADRMIVFSIAWLGVLMGLIGLAGSYWAIVVLVGLGVLGSAAFHPAGAVLAAASAKENRGTAMSFFSVGGNLGAAMSPLWVAMGIGWLGLPGTIVVIPVALLTALLLYQQLNDFDLNRATDSKSRSTSASPVKMPRTVMLSLALVTFVVMTRSWFQVSMITYLPEWIQSQGQSIGFGGQVLSIFLVAVGVGSMTGGPLSDWLGRWRIVAISLAVLALAQWGFLHASVLWQVVLIALMGLMIGASFPVTIVMAQEAWPNGVGLASSLVMGLGWAPGGLGAWVTGWLADQSTLGAGLQSLIMVPLLGVVGVLAYAALQQHIAGHRIPGVTN
ncbi:MAG: MFS transporter [Anaerolineae bacterium]|nr:MFS transporter [Anaerolineae bacterium]